MTTEAQRQSNAAIARGLLRAGELGLKMSADIAATTGDEYLAGNAPVAVLACLWLEESMRPRDLTAVIGLTSGGTTKVIDHLEETGLVVRDADSVDDGRGVAVTLTAEGRAVTERILGVVGPSLVQLASDLAVLRGD